MIRPGCVVTEKEVVQKYSRSHTAGKACSVADRKKKEDEI